jgi:hypothetical protein
VGIDYRGEEEGRNIRGEGRDRGEREGMII